MTNFPSSPIFLVLKILLLHAINSIASNCCTVLQGLCHGVVKCHWHEMSMHQPWFYHLFPPTTPPPPSPKTTHTNRQKNNLLLQYKLHQISSSLSRCSKFSKKNKKKNRSIMWDWKETFNHLSTEPREVHFFSNIYQKRSWNKKNWKSNQNNNISFKRLIIFPFQYWAEWKLNKKIRTEIKTTNVSFKQLIIFPFQPSAIFFRWLHQPMAGQDYIDLKRYYVVKSGYLSWINDLISFIYSVNIGKER